MVKYVSDFISIYPNPYDRNFQGEIAAMAEFNRFKSGSVEIPQPGGYFKHQLLTHQILTTIDHLLVISQTGTGKTKEILGFIDKAFQEYIKRNIGQPYDERIAHFEHVYIFVPGKAQVDEIKKQLVCDINRSFLTPAVKNADSEKNRDNALKRLLKAAGIEITTYRKFSNMVKKENPKFENCIFWVDEAHNLSSPESSEEDRDSTYESFWRIFHECERSKIIISTATPMMNSENELRLLMNLILPTKIPYEMNIESLSTLEFSVWFPGLSRRATRKQLEEGFRGQIPDQNIRNLSQEVLEVYFRGRVSYIRALDNGIDVVYEGESLNREILDPESNTLVHVTSNTFETEGSDHQTKAFYKALDEKTQGVYTAEKQSSLFVPPDGIVTIGDPEQGISKYVGKSATGLYPKNNLQRYIRDLNGIYHLSAKFGAIIEILLTQKGKDFIFCELIEGGVNPFILCLEAQGFQFFKESTSVFEIFESMKTQDYCAASDPKKKVRSSFSKAPRFGVISPMMTDAQRQTMIELYNSYENRHGDYIKAIIGSRIARDGINLSDVLRIHLLTPGWNDSVNYQAESRGIRATSHKFLLEEMRQNGIENPRIKVSVYYHAAVFERDGVMNSYDNFVYSTAEAKARSIHRILRIMKMASVGCPITYSRNVRDTDVDGSKVCDYQTCRYECLNEGVSSETMYGSLEASSLNDISMIIREVKFIFKNRSFVEDFYELIPEFRPALIDEALEKIISEGISIIDRYGNINYVMQRGKFYVLSNYIGDENLGDNSFVFSDIESAKSLRKIDPEKFRKMFNEGKMKDVNSFISSTDPGNRAIIVEDLISKVQSGEIAKTDKYARWIWTKFGKFIFEFNEPVTEISEMDDAKIVGKKKRGKKSKNPDKVKVRNYKDKELDEFIEEGKWQDPKGQKLIAHIVYSQSNDRTKYSSTARFNKAQGEIRILKNGSWSSVPNTQVPIYNKIIQILNRIKIKPYEDYKVYGTLDLDGTFRIRNKLVEQEGSDENGRKVKRGRECSTCSRKELIDIMWEIGLEDVGEVDPKANRQELIEYLMNFINHPRWEIESWDMKRVWFYYYWYYDWKDSGKSTTVDEICLLTFEKMQNEKRIY